MFAGYLVGVMVVLLFVAVFGCTFVGWWVGVWFRWLWLVVLWLVNWCCVFGFVWFDYCGLLLSIVLGGSLP